MLRRHAPYFLSMHRNRHTFTPALPWDWYTQTLNMCSNTYGLQDQALPTAPAPESADEHGVEVTNIFLMGVAIPNRDINA